MTVAIGLTARAAAARCPRRTAGRGELAARRETNIPCRRRPSGTLRGDWMHIRRFINRLKTHVERYIRETSWRRLSAPRPTASRSLAGTKSASPSAVEGPHAYLKREVPLEFGGRHVIDPNEQHEIVPDIEAETPGLDFPAATVTVLSPARTLWEKATLIHFECHRSQLADRPDRLSRLWFDLACLAQHDVDRASRAARIVGAESPEFDPLIERIRALEAVANRRGRIRGPVATRPVVRAPNPARCTPQPAPPSVTRTIHSPQRHRRYTIRSTSPMRTTLEVRHGQGSARSVRPPTDIPGPHVDPRSAEPGEPHCTRRQDLGCLHRNPRRARRRTSADDKHLQQRTSNRTTVMVCPP